MPTVPRYDSFQVAPTSLPQVRATAPEMADFAGQQAQQIGRGLMQAGDALGRVAEDMAIQANQVRFDAAATQAREAAARRRFGDGG